MHSPWVKSEALVKEVCKHQDAALIVLLPCDPQQSVAGEMKIVKEIETAGLEVGQARRLTCMLKCQKDEAVAIQHLLVVTAKELPMRPLRTRIFQSSAFRETWLKETCGYEPGPRGENGHPIWTGGAVSRSFLKSLFTKLDCWPLVDEYILETDPHWDFLMEVQGCQGGWVGLHSHAAAAKVKVLQRCLESVPKSMAQQESDPGNDHLKDLFSNAIAGIQGQALFACTFSPDSLRIWITYVHMRFLQNLR